MPTVKKPTKKPIKKETVQETKQETCCREFGKDNNCKNCTKTGGGFYCLGIIGAAIYFIGHATTFRLGVLGLLKALVRPVFLVHGLLKFLGL